VSAELLSWLHDDVADAFCSGGSGAALKHYHDTGKK
jgi:hypothetical protein